MSDTERLAQLVKELSELESRTTEIWTEINDILDSVNPREDTRDE